MNIKEITTAYYQSVDEAFAYIRAELEANGDIILWDDTDVISDDYYELPSTYGYGKHGTYYESKITRITKEGVVHSYDLEDETYKITKLSNLEGSTVILILDNIEANDE